MPNRRYVAVSRPAAKGLKLIAALKGALFFAQLHQDLEIIDGENQPLHLLGLAGFVVVGAHH